MKIETAGIVGRKTGNKFGVIVKDYREVSNFVYELKNDSTINQVELMAIKFALLGVSCEPPVTISTPSQYAVDMTMHTPESATEWLRSPKSNKELVDEIRELMIQKSATVIYEKNEHVRELCRK